jgi:hypothetical protein
VPEDDDARDQPHPRVRFLILLLFVVGLLATPWLLLREAFGDQTYVQKFVIPGGSIEVDSGDGDPIFGFTATVKFREGRDWKGHLGYTATALRHKLVSSNHSPVVGLVEKSRSHQVVMLVDTNTGKVWQAGNSGSEGQILLDQLRTATGKDLYLAHGHEG